MYHGWYLNITQCTKVLKTPVQMHDIVRFYFQQHDLIRAMTCLTEKDKRLSELDHELRALNAKKVELTTRKQDVSGDYLTYGIVFLFFVLSKN